MAGPGVPGGSGEPQHAQALIQKENWLLREMARHLSPWWSFWELHNSLCSFKLRKESPGRCLLSLQSVQSGNSLMLCYKCHWFRSDSWWRFQALELESNKEGKSHRPGWIGFVSIIPGLDQNVSPIPPSIGLFMRGPRWPYSSKYVLENGLANQSVPQIIFRSLWLHDLPPLTWVSCPQSFN